MNDEFTQNIIIGDMAGAYLTDAHNQFRLTNTENGELVEYGTKLTDEEFKIMRSVLSRALKNKKSLNYKTI